MTKPVVLALLLAAARVAAAGACAPPPAGQPAIAFGDAALVPICRGVYVNPAATPAEREHLEQDFDAATQRVVAALGPLQSAAPLTIFCKTEACQLYFAGTARRSWTVLAGERLTGATHVPRDLTIVVVHVGAVANVVTHELVHVELRARVRGASLPPWFNEGVATSIGNTPDCSAPSAPGIDDLRRLANNHAWADYTNLRGKLDPTYCQARAEFDAWTRRYGKQRLAELVAALQKGASFYDAYGELQTQGAGEMTTILTSHVADLADNRMPFSLALWIKPSAAAGVLAHVSSTDAGTGWCTPFLGFDGAGQLVAQVIHGNGPEPAQYAVAAYHAALPLHKWTHVAMTWAPGSFNRLYVNGAKVAETAAAGYNTRNATASMYVTWGSSNLGGGTAAACWQGAIVPGPLQGALAGPSIHNVELTAAQVAKLAATPP